MIEAYYRPETLEEAIRILQQNPGTTFPLGGGNVLSRRDLGKISVVDLQRLKLDKVERKGSTLMVGANTPLQTLVESELIPQAVKDAAIRDGTINLRRTSTLAGVLVSSKGVSPLGAVLIAMGAVIVTEQGGGSLALQDWIITLDPSKPGKLVVRVEIPTETQVRYMDISKTPADVPMAYAAMSAAKSGEKVWVVGFNKQPALFVERSKTLEDGIKNAYSHYSSMKNFNSYSKNMITVLFERLSADLSAEGRN